MTSFAKILLQEQHEDGSMGAETVWAHALGEDLYRIDNCVFTMDSVTYGDVVFAPVSNEAEMPTFKRVVKKSGNRILWVTFDTPALPGSESAAVLRHLVSLRCRYEGASPTFVAIIVPPSASLDDVVNYLREHKVAFKHA
jgi:hypothetical protein